VTSVSPPATPPLLELRGVYKSFGPVQVLRDVDFSIQAGQVTALVGDNGAGKSTLVKCVSGIYSHDAGEFRFEGRPVTIHNPRDAAALGIEIVYQDLALCDNLDIVQNMFLGRERRNGLVLDDPAMEISAAQVLASLAVRTVSSVRQRVASLSGGQRQTVAIAKAVLWNSRVVILDEPTAALGVRQSGVVLKYIAKARDRGLGVIFISHNPHHAYPVGDRFMLLRRGRSMGNFPKAEMPLEELIQMMAGGTELEALSHELARQMPDSDVSRSMQDEVAETLHTPDEAGTETSQETTRP
jgi:D-xylose transport system ATP-binding protein